MVLAFHQRARQRPYRPLFRKRVARVCNLDCWNIPVKFTMLMAAKACVMSHIESWSAGISFAVSQASKVAVLPQQTISTGDLLPLQHTLIRGHSKPFCWGLHVGIIPDLYLTADCAARCREPRR